MKIQSTLIQSLALIVGISGATTALGWQSSTSSVPDTVDASSSSSQAAVLPAAPATRLRLPLPGEMNALLIVLDDIGTDQLKMYTDDTGTPAYCATVQQPGARTPNLDDLRADGVMFSACYGNPSCSPTRAALLTGRYGRRTGIGLMINSGAPATEKLQASEVTLPELLGALNPIYARGAFGKWHLSSFPGDECNPIDAGFQVFQGMEANPDDHYEWRRIDASGAGSCGTWTSSTVPPIPNQTPDETFWDAGRTRADASAWINAQSTSPFFGYVAFSPPHAPWQVPPFSTLSAGTIGRLSYAGYVAGDEARVQDNQLQTDDQRLIYRANIEAIDYEIFKLLDDMDDAVLAKTMVFVIGDNGTVTDMIAHPTLKYHGKRTTYELGTRVPLVVSGPLVLPAAQGGTCREIVGSVDLWRTIANVTGLSNTAIDTYMSGATIDSISFMAQIQYPARASTRIVAYSEGFRNGLPYTVPTSQRAARNRDYRLIRKYNSVGVPSEEFYYNVTDPCELNALATGSLTIAQLAIRQALSNVLDTP